MRIKPFGDKFSFWVNKCTKCFDTTHLSLRKNAARMCRKCTREYRAMRAQAKAK